MSFLSFLVLYISFVLQLQFCFATSEVYIFKISARGYLRWWVGDIGKY